MTSRPHRSFAPRPAVSQALLAALVIALVIALVTAGTPAQASTKTLKRSVSNITQAPLDLVLSPMVALISVIEGMREQDDPVAVRVVFFLPGYVWNSGVNLGASFIRFVTGGLELLPGVALLPFRADLDTLFSPVENAAALFEMDTPCCIDVKFGINYTRYTPTGSDTQRRTGSSASY